MAYDGGVNLPGADVPVSGQKLPGPNRFRLQKKRRQI
jgi:hypothetical protein